MSDNEELVRQTIRIHPVTKRRLFIVTQKGKFITESEVIRRALNLGLDILEKEFDGSN